MGLLDYADEAGKRFLGLLGNMPLVQLLKAGQGEAPAPDVSPNALANTLKSIPVFQNSDQSNQEVANNLLNAVNPIGLLGKIVYHGSPHKFDKFDASKIGTGEGAQAYGHGVYMADNPNVASNYKAPNASGYPDPMALKDPEYWAADALYAAHGNPKRAVEHLTVQQPTYYGDKKTRDAAVALINGGKATKPREAFETGSLYKADLPDEWIPKMLDWDKPLSQQPDGVKKALANAPFETGIKDQQAWQGRDFLDMANKYAGSQDAGAAMLRDLGISGIKYLDGGSRGAGQGTHNYVIFPGLEDQIKILERNGIPINGLLGGP